jgi:hypothetical protein
MKNYRELVEEMTRTELDSLIAEAETDPRKMDILRFMLGEEIANTASAPGLAGVSTGEQPPVPPRTKYPMFRRKKKRRDDLI